MSHVTTSHCWRIAELMKLTPHLARRAVDELLEFPDKAIGQTLFQVQRARYSRDM
jgi:hypothetical protein